MFNGYTFYESREPEPAALFREQLARERRESSKKAKLPQRKNDLAERLRSKYFMSAARFVRLA